VNVEQALSLIRTIPDYPKPGILFQDITPVLSNPEAFTDARRSSSTSPGSNRKVNRLGTQLKPRLLTAPVNWPTA
jgi:adenine phosphoribosyltransferase